MLEGRSDEGGLRWRVRFWNEKCGEKRVRILSLFRWLVVALDFEMEFFFKSVVSSGEAGVVAFVDNGVWVEDEEDILA